MRVTMSVPMRSLRRLRRSTSGSLRRSRPFRVSRSKANRTRCPGAFLIADRSAWQSVTPPVACTHISPSIVADWPRSAWAEVATCAYFSVQAWPFRVKARVAVPAIASCVR